jgi:hypothetical protein
MLDASPGLDFETVIGATIRLELGWKIDVGNSGRFLSSPV